MNNITLKQLQDVLNVLEMDKLPLLKFILIGEILLKKESDDIELSEISKISQLIMYLYIISICKPSYTYEDYKLVYDKEYVKIGNLAPIMNKDVQLVDYLQPFIYYKNELLSKDELLNTDITVLFPFINQLVLLNNDLNKKIKELQSKISDIEELKNYIN